MHLCIQHQFVHGVCFSIFCWTAINNHLPTLLQEEKEKKKRKEKRKRFQMASGGWKRRRMLKGNCACRGEISKSIASKVRENLLVDLNE